MSLTTSILTLGAQAAPVYYGYEAYKDQKDSMAAAERRQQAMYDEQKQAMQEQLNKQNAPKANSSFIAALQKGGASPTMLTGPAGVDPNSLLLGKNTLLGA